MYRCRYRLPHRLHIQADYYDGRDATGRTEEHQPLQNYLPEFSVQSWFQTTADSITVRNLLSHHSGLPTDIRKGMWADRPFTSVTGQLRHEYLAYPPDMIFNYSNVGYTLLGHMLQKRSGRQFFE
ncbi:MAG: beta-lactamase family protein [Gammaproteobacteria bacterium]|nr:beta-lactamase family protein [Gammaproteobacteria bacterium]